MKPKENLATPVEVADYLSLSPNRLAKMRMEGDGPEFIRLGHRTIRYEWEAVREWVNIQAHASTEAYAV